MSETVYSSKYLDMYYEKEHSLMTYIWHESTSQMLDEEYKKELLEIVKASEERQIAKHLINTLKMTFAVSVDIQDWAAQNFYPPLMMSGSRKFSIVIPSDLFAQVSLQQAIEDGGVKDVVQTRYFDEVDMARQWVLGIL